MRQARTAAQAMLSSPRVRSAPANSTQTASSCSRMDRDGVLALVTITNSRHKAARARLCVQAGTFANNGVTGAECKVSLTARTSAWCASANQLVEVLPVASGLDASGEDGGVTGACVLSAAHISCKWNTSEACMQTTWRSQLCSAVCDGAASQIWLQAVIGTSSCQSNGGPSALAMRVTSCYGRVQGTLEVCCGGAWRTMLCFGPCLDHITSRVATTVQSTKLRLQKLRKREGCV